MYFYILDYIKKDSIKKKNLEEFNICWEFLNPGKANFLFVIAVNIVLDFKSVKTVTIQFMIIHKR